MPTKNSNKTPQPLDAALPACFTIAVIVKQQEAPAALEEHYTAAEIAALWKCARQTVVNIFGEMPGVLRYSAPQLRGKRQKQILRVPRSIVVAVHARLTAREVKARGRRVE